MRGWQLASPGCLGTSSLSDQAMFDLYGAVTLAGGTEIGQGAWLSEQQGNCKVLGSSLIVKHLL